ncbi:MAG: protein kinase [Planctomycetota bacterium]|nr:protein kinase [Planctomycetota bacterium]
MPTNRTPVTIGDYKVVDGPFLGGFGEVYKVLDRTWCDEFALKRLKRPFLASSASFARFRKEVEVWVRLPAHRNVVRAIEAFVFEVTPCLVMEWVSGGNLGQRMSSFSRDEALAVCRQLAEGLHHIHSHGVVHGDLKPANVLMWAELCPQITDFGLARSLVDGPIWIGGTPGYMAPELQSGNATVLSDLYSLGLVFRDVLGQFDDDAFGIARTRDLITEMVRADPLKRPASCSQVLDRLREMIHDSPCELCFVVPGDDRRTFKEKVTAEALPERYLMSQAHSEIAAGRQDDARRRLVQIITQRPDHADALTMLADLAAADGDNEQAISYLVQAKNAAAGNPQILFNICVSLVRIGKYVEAREILDNLDETEEMTNRIWRLRGDIADKEGDLSETLMCYRLALACGGDSSVVLALGRALHDAGILDEAMKLLRKIDLRDIQVGIPARIILARCLISKRQWENAVDTLRECLRQDVGAETSAYLYSEIGYAYMQQQLFEAAVAAFQKSLQCRPESETVLCNLEFCLTRLRR